MSTTYGANSTLASFDTQVFESPLEEERRKASFNPREMTYLLDGGKDNTLLTEQLFKLLERDPIFNSDRDHDMSRQELRERTFMRMKRMLEIYEMTGNKDASIRDVRSVALKKQMGLFDSSAETRTGVHYLLFRQTLRAQGTDELIAEYDPLITRLGIIGCFAMTELGHGSYVPGLQTRAVFDRDSDEFVLNSPTLTSAKWWIGGAGQSATHCVVFARLIIGDTDHGVHAFLVQLRSLEDHSLMPGVVAGDCGHKMGRNGLDNGWILFSEVRIPRTNMLMKYAKVDRQGRYTKPVKAQIAYAALIGGRVHIVDDSARQLQKSLTIAVRYGAVRRQFPAKEGQPERQILDYQTHKYRLMPLIAGSFGMHFTAERLENDYYAVMDTIESGEPDMRMLADLHSISSGLKAFCTWYTKAGLEVCRESCGGHGYSAYSELSTSLNDFAVQCSWEGDNTVICQQNAKSVMRMLQKAMMGTELEGTVAYLNRLEEIVDVKQSAATDGASMRDGRFILEAHQLMACKIIMQTGEQLQECIGDGMDELEAWNANLVQLIEVARHHTHTYMMESFHMAVERVMKEDAQLGGMLAKLFALWGLKNLEEHRALLLETGFVDTEQSHTLRAEVLALCDEVREQAVPLVDSFNIKDFVLKSPLGAYDGNVYEKYFAKVNAAEPMTDARGVPPYYESLIRPTLKRAAKL